MRVDEREHLRPGVGEEPGEAGGVLRQAALGAHVAHQQGGEGGPAPVDLVRLGAEGDVVAEEVRELLGVGMAADPGEQAAVVGGLAGLRIRAEEVREAHRDDAGPQHVLEREAEPEVDRERQGGDQLRALRPRARRAGLLHGATVDPGRRRGCRRPAALSLAACPTHRPTARSGTSLSRRRTS